MIVSFYSLADLARIKLTKMLAVLYIQLALFINLINAISTPTVAKAMEGREILKVYNLLQILCLRNSQ